MADIFIDGFDQYGPAGLLSPTPSSLILAGPAAWTSISAVTISISSGLSSTGMAISVANSSSLGSLNKTFAAAYSSFIGGLRFNSTLSFTSGITAKNSTTAQWSITIDAITGKISIRTGDIAGAAIATSAGGVSVNSTHYLEWNVTVGAAGAYQVWLDGVSILNGTGNTHSGSTTTADGISIALGSTGGAIAITVDDLYLFDSTGAMNNAVLLTNPRIETQFPTSDVQTQLTNGASIIGQDYSTTAATNAPGANELFLRKFTPSVTVTLNSVSVIPMATSAGAKFKAVAYSDSAGVPNTLLSSGTEVVGTITGITLVGPLVTPQTLTGGTAYWIGFITDTSVVLQEVDTTTTGQKAANTYTSGAPGTAPSMTALQASWTIYGHCTGATTNWSSENLNPPLGNDSYASSATVGQEDLFGFPALTTAPLNIYTVQVVAYAENTDAGVRTIDLHMKSGATDSAGSAAAQSPATTYGYLGSFFDADPATATAWTIAGLNAASSGIKVAS